MEGQSTSNGLSRRRTLGWLFDICVLGVLVASAIRFTAAGPAGEVDHLGPVVEVGKAFPGLPILKHAGKRAVLLRVEPTCFACNESIPFYERVAEAAGLSTEVVFLTMAPEATVSAWLKERGVEAGRVLTIESGGALGFLLQPTSLILDRSGTVTDLVLGKPTDAEADAFVSRIIEPSSPAVNNALYAREISEAEMVAAAASGALVVDIRDRHDFSESPVSGSVNIPEAELAVRSTSELAGRSVVFLCGDLPAQRCRFAGMSMRAQGLDVIGIRLK